MNSPSPISEQPTLSRYYWLILLVFLGPWFYLRLLQVTHSDILWLSEAARRILEGGSMSGDAYDPNPPLSIILYMLPTLAQKYLSVPIHFGALAQAFTILGASVFVLQRTLQNFQDLTLNARHLIITAFIAYNTIGAGLVFGERDHLIAMVLPPFVLMQLSLTLHPDKKSPCWLWAFSLLAATLILLKPPHGLLPTILLAHRVLYRRTLSVLRDADFVGLSVVTLSYAAVIALFFSDYVSTVLPDMLRYYYPSVSDSSLTRNLSILLGSTALLTAAAYILKIPVASKKMIVFLFLAAAVSTIPIAVQVKGFYYHYLPALVFLFCGAMLLIHEFLAREIKNQRLASLAAVLTSVMLAFSVAPPVMNYPRHGQYMSLPLPALVAQDAKDAQAIYIFNDDMSLSHEIAYYGGYLHASRFPSLWFLPGLYDARARGLPHWKDDQTRFATMIAADLEKDRPDLVLILSPDHFAEKIDPITFFSDAPAFKSAWSHYEYVQSTTVVARDYFGRAAKGQPDKTFLIYRRR